MARPTKEGGGGVPNNRQDAKNRHLCNFKASPTSNISLAVHALMVKDYEEATRFPHLCPGEAVPARHFGPAQARVAMEHASAVLAAVKGVMEV